MYNCVCIMYGRYISERDDKKNHTETPNHFSDDIKPKNFALIIFTFSDIKMLNRILCFALHT